jgi:hypothetical protein
MAGQFAEAYTNSFFGYQIMAASVGLIFYNSFSNNLLALLVCKVGY